MTTDSPLGKATDYPNKYSPEALHPVPRALAREPIGISDELPFAGVDIWDPRLQLFVTFRPPRVAIKLARAEFVIR